MENLALTNENVKKSNPSLRTEISGLLWVVESVECLA